MTRHSKVIDVSAFADARIYSGVGLGVPSGEGTCHVMDADYPLGRRHSLGHSRYIANGVEGRRSETRRHHHRYRRDDTVPLDSAAFRRPETH